MKNFLRLSVLFVLVVFSSEKMSAQLYKTNLGVRIDESQFGISFDQKIYEQFTAQAAFDARENEIRATAIARYHIKLLGRRLNFYPGIGAHTGILKEYGRYDGFDLLMGIEYKIMIAPVVISFDVNPAFHTGGNHANWWDFQTVFSIKYILVKDKKKLFEKWRDRND
jgi:hypothetical protein